ncbi:MAG: hypothetical protein IAE97_02615 [Chthoniobacterales bacterium]|nr:hypothetical protein [Chthoniobacterales bacterium]
MMRRLFLCGVVVTQLLGSFCAAQGFDSGYFHSNSYPRTYSITFTPVGAPLAEQWYTDDPYVVTNIFVTNAWVTKGIGDTSLARYINGTYTPGASSNGFSSVVFGTYAWSSGQYYDYLPGRTNPSLFKWFPPAVTNAGRKVKLLAEFSIIRSPDVAWPTKDKFGVELFTKTTNGGQTNLISLASFDFNPNAAALTNISTYLFEWRRGGIQQSPAVPGLTGLWPLTYGSIYRLTATISGSEFDLDLDLLSSPTGTNVWTVKLISGGALAPGFTAADFNMLAVNWRLTSTNPFAPGGKNYILFNRLAVLPIPNAIENWLTAGGWPASTPLGTKTNGQAFSLLEQYAMGASAPGAAFEKPATRQVAMEETTWLELVSVVRTNDPKVTVVGEAVHDLAEFAEPGSITPVAGMASGVDQAGVPAGCERRAFRVPVTGVAQQFLRLSARSAE